MDLFMSSEEKCDTKQVKRERYFEKKRFDNYHDILVLRHSSNGGTACTWVDFWKDAKLLWDLYRAEGEYISPEKAYEIILEKRYQNFVG